MGINAEIGIAMGDLWRNPTVCFEFSLCKKLSQVNRRCYHAL
jgi:hypothetical protein